MCSALAQVAKHSVDLAEVVVEAELFPKCLTCLQYPDDAVRKAAATLCREVGSDWTCGLAASLMPGWCWPGPQRHGWLLGLHSCLILAAAHWRLCRW